MDSKRFLTTLLLSGAIMYLVWNFMNPPAAKPGGAAATVAATSTAPAPDALVPIQTITLGGADVADREKVKVVVSAFTAGIDLVQLNVKDYPETLKGKDPFTLMKADPPAPKPFATLRVHINGAPFDLSKWVWPVESATRTEARLAIKLGDLGILRKIITINPDRYDVTVTHEVENLTDQPLNISIDQLGPTDLNYDSTQIDPRTYQAAAINSARLYIEPNKVLLDQPTAAKNALDEKTRPNNFLGTFKGTDHLVWVAAEDRFFTIIVRPTGGPDVLTTTETTPSGTIITPNFAGDATVEWLGERPLPNQATWKITGLNLTGNTLTIAPKGIARMPLAVYMGPKKRDLLAGNPNAAVGSPDFDYSLYVYGKTLKYGQGPCAFCTFDPVVLFILSLLDFVHNHITFGNYGLAIILLVIVVRLLLHPLTRSGQVSMITMQKKMAAIAPDIEAAKKRYAKDKAQLQAETMKIYKEHNVNPAAPVMGCLPTFLQTPIWMALYGGLRLDIDLRHAAFIPGWINDLSDPDTVALFQTGVHIPILGITIGGVNYLALNVLPILLAILFFVQMRVQAKTQPKPADDSQAQAQKMSQYMIFIMPLFLYTAPSGLNLYIFASTIGGLFDTWLVRRHMRAKGLLEPK